MLQGVIGLFLGGISREAQAIDPFGQVKGGLKIAGLRQGERDPHHFALSRVPLRQGNAVLKNIDHRILKERCLTFIDKGDDGRVEFVFYRKHIGSLADIWSTANREIVRAKGLVAWGRSDMMLPNHEAVKLEISHPVDLGTCCSGRV